MQSIIATIKPGDSGSIVANLQDALFALLEHQIIRALDAPSRPTLEMLQELVEILKKEREQSIFGKATQQLITYFQIQQSLGDHLFGAVEKTTAAKLNEYLEKLDLLKNDSNFIVKGHIFDKEEGKALTDVIVRAFDWYKEVYTLLGETSADQKGLYQIEFLEKAFKNIESDRKNPDLIVRIYDQKNKQIAQSKQVDKAEHITELDVEVDTAPFRVYGVVLDSTGKPVKNANVKAFDRDLRTLQLLGDSTIDTAGHYEIKYDRQKFVRSEKDSADLEIHVFDDKDALLVKSETAFNVPDKIEINLTLPDTSMHLSEFELLVQAILPLLKGQGADNMDLAIEALQSSDIQFLAKDTGKSVEKINFLVIAAKLSSDTEAGSLIAASHVEETNVASIPDSVFYAWLRKGHPESLSALRKEAASKLRISLLAAINESIIPPILKEQVDLLIALLGNPEWKEVKEFLQAIGLEPIEQALLSEHFDQLDGINDIALTGLLQTDVLTEAQTDRLGLAVSLQRLVQGPMTKLNSLLDFSLPQLDRSLAKSEDLARLHPQDWMNLLAVAGIEPPPGLSIEEHASNLEEIAVAAFPTIGLLNRLMRIPKTLKTQFQAIQPQTESLKKLWELSFNDPAVPEIVAALPSEQQEAVFEIQQFVRSHPGLDTGLPFKKLQEVSLEWMDNLNKLIESNIALDILALDYSTLADKPLTLNFGDLPRESLIRELKGVQRMLAVADTPTGAQILLRAGLYSASQVALYTQKELVDMTGLDEADVVELHGRAKLQSDQVGVAYFTILDAARTQRMLTGAAKIGEIQQLDVLRKLFGNLDACECAHCLSVLSPAAYFVDLMYYVESHISPPIEINRSLKARRADLWELPLSCDNTHTIVPMLDIVNRILEGWLKREMNVDSSFAVFNEIATQATTSFSLPVNFPLQRLEILLAHFGLSRDRVAQALDWTTTDRVRTRLQVTFDEVSLITSPKTVDLANAVMYFSLLYQISTNLSQINANDLSVGEYNLSKLQHQTKIDRNILRVLVSSKFVSADGSTNQPVTVVLVASSDAVQNDMEMTRNLSVRRLDRLHRFIRLWRTLPWTVGELDYVLARLATQRSLSPAELTPEILADIVSLLDLADRTRLPVDELMSLIGALPSIGLRDDDSLFDRRFNTKPFVERDGKWPDSLPAELKHPAFSPDTGLSAPDKNTLMRLLAALQIDDPQFLALVNGLSAAPVIAGVPNDTLLKQIGAGRKVIRLTPISLALLYRHARLGILLGVKAPELLRLVALTPEISSKPAGTQFIESMLDLLALLRFVDAQKSSGYTLEQIEWLLDPTRVPLATRSARDIAVAVVKRIADERLLMISSETLTTVGLTEIESVQAIKDLGVALLESIDSAGEHRLNSTVPLDQIKPEVIRALSASVDFDVAESAILAHARTLGEFEDTTFSALYLDEATSKRIVADNLVSDAQPANAFKKIRDEDLTVTPAQHSKYRINPDFEQALPRTHLKNSAGYSYVELADRMVRGLLSELNAASDARITAGTVFNRLYLSAQQSRWLVAANTSDTVTQLRPFVKTSTANGLALNPQFLTARTPPLVLTNLVTPHIAAQLQRYHWQTAFDHVVSAELGMEVGKVAEFRMYDVPATPHINALLGLTTDLQPLIRWIAQAQRLQCLVQAAVFDIADVKLVLRTWPQTTPAATQQVLWWQILSVSAYARWLKAAGTAEPAASIRRAAIRRLSQAPSDQALSGSDVAEALAVPVESILGANLVAPTQGEWFRQLDQWNLIAEIINRLGVSGETLNRMRPRTVLKVIGLNTVAPIEDVDSLWRAADDVHAAFRAKYPDTATFQKKSEAFEELTRSKRRDALVAFLTNKYAFQGPSHLYAHFLIDVEIGGCARTSELVAATTSVQLYVHRVFLNLELSDARSDPQKLVQFTSVAASKEWVWRKHYRVWEANRKVFLYPENFIEPDLRDDKTPLFRELETELLQRQISTSEAEHGYAKYLTGYNEVASLKVIGAFHDHDTDVLHLVGVTESDPPVHYLRQVNNMARSERDLAKPLQFMPWEKLGTPIPVKWVSPVVFQRKLMLFWTEITTVPSNREIDEKNYFTGYEHKFKVKWIERKNEGSWTSPQRVDFLDGASNWKQSLRDPLIFVRGPDANPQYPSSLPMVVTEESPNKFITTPLYEVFLNLLRKRSSAEISFSALFKAVPKHQVLLDYARITQHSLPDESYTLAGWGWERVFPTVRYIRVDDTITETLQVAAMNSAAHGFMPVGERRIPFTPPSDIEVGSNNLLSAHWMYSFFRKGNELGISSSNAIRPVGHHVVCSTDYLLTEKSSGTRIAEFSANIADGLVVNSRAIVSTPGNNASPFRASAIVHAGAFQVLAINGTQPRLVSLSSSLAPRVSQQLAAQRLPGLLNLKFQQDLNETEPLVGMTIAPPFGSGSFGSYVRETFFHIPFLIANHLNSQQRFAESQQWYHYIFNPMDATNPWQYREFAGRPVESMREALTDEAALAAYREDPFNPHAIARTRLSAYQKSIAMKYIDNLLDWGDKLFSQFTMESVNEATMLYVLASDILGEKPAQLPQCAEETPRTYAQIRPNLSKISDFLIEEIEQIIIKPNKHKGAEKTIKFPVSSAKNIRTRSTSIESTSQALSIGGVNGVDNYSGIAPIRGATVWTSTNGTPLSHLQPGDRGSRIELSTIGTQSERLIGGNIDFVPGGSPVIEGLFAKEPHIDVRGPGTTSPAVGLLDIKYTLENIPPPHRDVHHLEPPKIETIELVSATSVFCFPQNEELLAYWNRVEDRLYKVRNCMDIAGVRRRLDLFAPEIDPHLLVRMKASGLSLEDVLDVTTGHAPPYRFAVLLEKARQYASTVQSLGGQLLAALEKRDAEELAAMRSVHEQQLLEMRTQLMRWEVDASNDALEGVRKQKEAAEYRKEHYDSLIANGLSGWEHAQSAATISATSLSSSSAVHDIAAAIAGFVPQVHTPTIVGATAETGGRSVSEGLARLSSSFKTMAGIADRIGGLAGLEGGFQRRAEEWEHQAQLVAHELKQIDRQIEAAEIRVLIAERSLETHEKSINQAREVYDFYRNKFSNLGLYTWMSTQLHRMHRLAFNTAWSMARMTEKALHFERPDLRDSVTLGVPAWDAGHAGLLAGEGLLLELQRMEMRHLETNYRELEIEQAFSLAQFGADQLLELQTTGTCEFNIPEFFFDLHYPGQYRRRIKAVRLTLPCVVGPYGNVGATLTLTRSELRDRPQPSAPLQQVPLRHAPTIAVSSAQNDAGVFEFSFRDERFMPFEGMGAISTWKLSLPRTVRSFDYSTISDVILRINYTAMEDSTLRDDIERSNSTIMLTRFQEAAPVRIFSVRHDFPAVWAQFKNSQPNASQRCELKLPLKAEHFPFWASTFVDSSIFQASLIIDSSSTSAISIFKTSLAPEDPTTTEEKDDIPVLDQGEGYHSGPLIATSPNAPVGDWMVYFSSGDRDLIDNLWLVINW